MPRKPMGDHAMTAAERKRRQRDKAVTKPVTKTDVTEPVTKPEIDPAVLSELVEARKEVEKLRGENAVIRMLYEDKQAKTATRKAKAAAADRAVAEGYANEDHEALLEKLVQADKQLAANKTRIRNLTAKVGYLSDHFPPTMSKRLHRQVLGWLHPDRAHGDDVQRLDLEKCFRDFGAIKFRFSPDDTG
jgi:hypothetical protein